MPLNIVFGHRQVTTYDGSTGESWWPYTCGHCGNQVSGAVVASAIESFHGNVAVRWLQCPHCHDGAVSTADGSVYPGTLFGPSLQGLPPETEGAYNEARMCFSINAFTATELMCRKILMHVAVDKGASEGATFASYIDHLQELGYITPPMEGWVTLIKTHGNRAAHDISPSTSERAKSTLLFTVQLLRSAYEMGFIAAQFAPPGTSEANGD